MNKVILVAILVAIVSAGSNNNGWTRRNTSIEKSALALLKIYQLIEVGYGGNISSEEWNNNEWKFTYQYTKTGIDIISTRISKYIIVFHTKEQAEEFLSYPENIQLLKDYFMIDK